MILKNFIVFEGLDGSGTTSQIRLLQDAFQKQSNDNIVFTAEPTDTVIGKLIRTALSGAIGFDERTIAYLFGADRCEHIYGKNGILAALQAGCAVFSDRYLFSSLAYQGLTAGSQLTAGINAPFPLPEYLFFFDVPSETAMERINKRSMQHEVYERALFQQQVAQTYEQIFFSIQEKEPEMSFIRINALQSIKEIHKKIWSIVRYLPKL